MQRRSASRRRSTVSKPPFYRNKRIIAIGAAGVALVSLLAVTQISDASTRRQREAWQRSHCGPATATANAPATGSQPGTASTTKAGSTTGADPKAGDVPLPGQMAGTLDGGVQNGRQVTNYAGDGQESGAQRWHRPGCPTPSAAASPSTNATNGTSAPGGGATSTPGGGGATSTPGTGTTAPTAAPTTNAPLEILG